MSRWKKSIRKIIYSDRLFDIVNCIVLTLLFLLVLYPVIYVISSSFSNSIAVTSGKVFLLPIDFNLNAYKKVLEYKDIWIGYGNTILYAVVYTTLSLILTIFAAYPLSRDILPCRNILSFIFAFSMWFSGGVIPSYLLIKNLHMLDSIWAVVLPGAFSAYNMIILRTAFQTGIPTELFEAARMDGCSDWKYLNKIAIPLSKPTLVVLGMFCVVGIWNSYMSPFLYLDSRNKYPLQLILREILLLSQSSSLNEMDAVIGMTADQQAEMATIYEVIKYAVIVLSTLPLAIAYPFLQRYFQKGMMVGAVKG